MCPPGYYHNGFMATPKLGHRMYICSNITENSVKVEIDSTCYCYYLFYDFIFEILIYL